MANLKLSSVEIRRLISEYESSLRQLQFRVEHTRRMIRELKDAIPAIEAQELAQIASIAENAAPIIETAAAPAPARRGRPKGRRGRPKGSGRKAAAAKTTEEAVSASKPKKGRKSRKVKPSGYRLSEVDVLIMDALGETGKAMINSDLQTFIEDKKKAAGESFDSDDIALKISRSLQKLANRRSDLAKVPYEGRGKAYALPSWLNGKGDLKRKHKR